VVYGVRMHPYAYPEIEAGCSLKWFTASTQIEWSRGIRQFSKIGGNICGGDGVMMNLHAHAQHEKGYKNTLDM
jgi:hypothetical protein